MVRGVLAIATALLLGQATAFAQDVVEYFDAAGKLQVARGKIVKEGADGLQVQGNTGGVVSVTVPQINSIKYDGQPVNLIVTRGKLAQGRFDEAAAELKEMSQTPEVSGNPLLMQAVIFDVFQAQAEAAIADPALANEALQTAQKFDSSFAGGRHDYPLYELWGRVLLASGKFAEASEKFAKLRTVTWPGYKEKALVYQGVAALRQGNAREAIQNFDQVLAASGSDRVIVEQKYFAQAYKGKALVESGDAAGAEKLLTQALEEMPASALEVKAIGHNALGDALLALGKPKEAMLDGYMWVNVMYNKYPKETARAMYQISQIFNQLEDRQRAQLMAARLVAMYPQSEWAQKLSGGSGG